MGESHSGNCGGLCSTSKGDDYLQISNNKDKGRAGLALAIAYFGTNGYTVSTPLNDTQWYDLIVEKDGIFKTVQCKFTDSKNGEIQLTSCGGTKGTKYDNVLNHSLDILFCADSNMNLFVIPMDALRAAGNTKSIRLRTERSPLANANTFDTSQFLVQI